LLSFPRNTGPLYFIYLLFLIAAFFAGNINVLYVSEFLSVGVLFYFSFSKNGLLIFLRNYFNLAAVLLLTVCIYVSGAEIYTFLVIIKIVLLFKLFSAYEVDEKDLLKFTNQTYLVYFTICLLNYFYVISIGSLGEFNAFSETIAGISFVTLFSFEGSTAGIDSYSGLIFIINVLLNKDLKSKKCMSGISLFALLWTTRMTPIVATLGAFVYYYVYPLSLIYVLPIFIFLQFSLIIWLQGQSDLIRFFFSAITHARSSMWTQHLEVFLETLSLREFFFSTYDDRYLVRVYGFQAETSNPHNSYLLLLYNSVIGFLILTYLFLKRASNISNSRWKTLIFFILVAAVTNSKIIGLGNPVYIILTTYFFYWSLPNSFRDSFILQKC
jgi:hypothetical protein